MFDMVLKGGFVFLDNKLFKSDLAIAGEKIAAIGLNLPGEKQIDVSGKWVLPGAIDAHTHFSLPFAGAVSADDFFSGTRAGAVGGVTTIIDFLAQSGDEGILASLDRRMAQAMGFATTDFSFHACIGRFSDAVAKDLPEMLNRGLTSLKVFTAYKKAGLMQPDAELLKIMRHCQELGIMLTVHAENGELIDSLMAEKEATGIPGIESLSATRPTLSEVEAIARIAMFARTTGCYTYIVHTSSGDGAATIAKAREEGAPIVAESCPQYLYLDDSLLKGPSGHYFACCPPIRSLEQQNKLWRLVEGAVISVLATDHCPFTRANKDLWNGNINNLPMGLPGIETLPAMVLNRHKGLEPVAAIKLISENPAKLFGMYPEKGSLLPGTDADIMVFDPGIEWRVCADELSMKTDYSPYEGLKILGKNQLTFLRGNMIYHHGQGWLGKQGAGKFLQRKKTDPAFFKRDLPLG